jgi:hypothetical protein
MTGLSMVRMISDVGVRLAVRTGSGGHPTDRWQDKSRSPARSAGCGRSKISDWRDVRYCATACVREKPSNFSRLHIAPWHTMTATTIYASDWAVRDRGRRSRASLHCAGAGAAEKPAGSTAIDGAKQHLRPGRAASSLRAEE